jgi:uroporphyrinogen decarboxylase
MEKLCGKERISRQLKHQPVDRIGVYESFWGETVKKWTREGKLKAGEDTTEHFDLDIMMSWCFNLKIHPLQEDKLISEDEDTKTLLDGNGATLKRHKKHDSTPEHIGFAISSRDDWEKLAKPFLLPEKLRINFDQYRDLRQRGERDGRFFVWGGVNVFECMHPICGHENMLMGMALDPDWVRDMADTYANLLINLMEITYAEAGRPDGVWFFEDMGFKGRPFMSPEMYRELIMPAHKKTIEYVHSLGLPVIMHSCGYVEPLLPDMVEAGIDCLQAMEIKAGMDLLRIHKNFGDKIALMGGIDARCVADNDRAWIDRELNAKIPFVKDNYGFILHTDHSIPESTDYENYLYFKETGLKLGTY